MSDPVFGMLYDPAKVRFEFTPASLGRACFNDPHRRFWLYGYWKDAGAEYFIVSDRVAEESGVGLVLRGAKCTEGLPDWLLSGDSKIGGPDKDDPSIRLTDSVMQGLSRDLPHRQNLRPG